MQIGQAVAVVGGVLGIISFLYVILRVGFRVDVLWVTKDQTDELDKAVAVLAERVRNIELFNLHKAETEARVTRAVRERD